MSMRPGSWPPYGRVPFILCCYWLTFLIASRCIWNLFMIWLDFIVPCFLVLYIRGGIAQNKIRNGRHRAHTNCHFSKSPKLHHFSPSLDSECKTQKVFISSKELQNKVDFVSIVRKAASAIFGLGDVGRSRTSIFSYRLPHSNKRAMPGRWHKRTKPGSAHPLLGQCVLRKTASSPLGLPTVFLLSAQRRHNGDGDSNGDGPVLFPADLNSLTGKFAVDVLALLGVTRDLFVAPGLLEALLSGSVGTKSQFDPLFAVTVGLSARRRIFLPRDVKG